MADTTDDKIKSKNSNNTPPAKDSSSDKKETSFWDDVKSVGNLVTESWSYSNDNYDPTLNRVGIGMAGGAVVGATTGAATVAVAGGTAGTVVVPGLGTAVGTAGGAVIGAVGGTVVGGVGGAIAAVTHETTKEKEKESRRWDAFTGNIDPNEGKEEAEKAFSKIDPVIFATKTNPHCICDDPICTENAIIQCAWGSAFAKLHVVAPKRTLIGPFKNRVIIPADVLAGANMEGFGACWNLANPLTLSMTITASAIAQKFVWTPSPCTASIAPTPWLPTQIVGYQSPVPVVTQKSVCVCWGLGIISFIDNGQNNNAAPVRFDCGNWKENVHNAIKVATFGLGGVASIAGSVAKFAKAAEAVNAAKAAKLAQVANIAQKVGVGADGTSALLTGVDGGIYLSEGKKMEAIMSFAMAGLGAWGTAGGIRNIARGDDAIAITEQIAKRRNEVIKIAEAKTPAEFQSLLKRTDDGLLNAIKNSTAKGSSSNLGQKLNNLTSKGTELDTNLAKVEALGRAKGNVTNKSTKLSKAIKERDGIVDIMDGLQKERATAMESLTASLRNQKSAKEAFIKAEGALEKARAENGAALKQYLNGEISQSEWLEVSGKLTKAENAWTEAKNALKLADDGVTDAAQVAKDINKRIEPVRNKLTDANGKVISAMNDYEKAVSKSSGIISQEDEIIQNAKKVLGERNDIINSIQNDLAIVSNNKVSHGLDMIDSVVTHEATGISKGIISQDLMTHAIIDDNPDLVDLINDPEKRKYTLDNDAIAQLTADDNNNNNK